MTNKEIAELGVSLASNLLGLSELIILYRPASHFSGDDVNALFIKSKYFIVFKDEWIETAYQFDILTSAFHETRHAYQNAQVDFPEEFKYKELKEVIDKWKMELANYKASPNISEEHDKQYLDQDIELDAIAFEHYLAMRLFKEDLEPHEYAVDRVREKREQFKIKYDEIRIEKLKLDE